MPTPQERYQGSSWLEAGVVHTDEEGVWIKNPDGTMRYEDFPRQQTPYGPNPTEFISHPGTDMNASLTDEERSALRRYGLPGGPVLDPVTGFRPEDLAIQDPTREELWEAHQAKLRDDGIIFGD